MSTEPIAVLPAPAAAPRAARASSAAAAPVSLRRNSAWMLAGNIVYSGCQWANVAVLARLGTEAMVGQLVLAMAVTVPVAALFMMQLRMVQATDAIRHYRFGDYMALRLVTTCLSLAALLLICAFSGYQRDNVWAIAALGLSLAVDSVSDVVYGLLQQRERLDRIAQSLIGKGVLSLLAMAGVVALTGRVYCGILAMAAVRLGVLLAWDVRQGRAALAAVGPGPAAGSQAAGQWLHWDVGRLRRLAWLALPLGLVMGVQTLNNSIPRYFVEGQVGLGTRGLGILGAIGYLSMVGTILVGAVGESAAPRLARYYRQGRRGPFLRLVCGLLAGGLGLGLAGVGLALLAGPQILALLYGRAYARHGSLLVWMMVAGGVGYVVSFTGYAITSARYFRIQIPLIALTAASTFGACWWFIPRYGLMGAAYAMAGSSLVQLLGIGAVLAHALYGRRESPLPDQAQ